MTTNGNRTVSERKRGKGRRFLAFLALALALGMGATLTGCEQRKEGQFAGGFLLTGEEIERLVIVRSDDASDLVVKQALRIRDYVEAVTGGRAKIVTDWQRGEEAAAADEDEDSPPLEILVGCTRQGSSPALESEMAAGNFYRIFTDGRRIQIAATSERLLPDAVELFLNKYCYSERGSLRIAEEIDYRGGDYSFFEIARAGQAKCGFVLPETAGEPLRAAVDFVVRSLEREYGCRFSVVSEKEAASLARRIEVGTAAAGGAAPEGLPADGGFVKCEGNRLLIAGKTEGALLHALSRFYTSLEADSDFGGAPYVYCPADLALSCRWEHEAPYFLGAELSAEEEISSKETAVRFCGVNEALLENYKSLCELCGFSIVRAADSRLGTLLLENKTLRIQLNFEGENASLYILKK